MQGNAGYTQYRLWLIPNSIATQSQKPLETGFLPVLTFNNTLVKQLNNPKTNLGNGEAGYTSGKEFTDAAGNSGCISNNRVVQLVQEKTESSTICSVNGNTVAHAAPAANFSWAISSEPGMQGEMVPLFHYFGFTVNMQSFTSI
jgi:hypothetical protein